MTALPKAAWLGVIKGESPGSSSGPSGPPGRVVIGMKVSPVKMKHRDAQEQRVTSEMFRMVDVLLGRRLVSYSSFQSCSPGRKYTIYIIHRT